MKSRLRARGAFAVGLRWDGGQLESAEILSYGGEPCVVRYRERTVNWKTKAGMVYRFGRDL